MDAVTRRELCLMNALYRAAKELFSFSGKAPNSNDLQLIVNRWIASIDSDEQSPLEIAPRTDG